MVIRLSSAALHSILIRARAEPSREICGVLWGTDDRILAAQAMTNVAADPARRFEIDPRELLAAHRRARRLLRLRIIGHYHSHPSGDATPSARDAADAHPDGSLWLIAAGNRVLLWRATPGGALHDRFDPVPFAVDGVARAPSASTSTVTLCEERAALRRDEAERPGSNA